MNDSIPKRKITPELETKLRNIGENILDEYPEFGGQKMDVHIYSCATEAWTFENRSDKDVNEFHIQIGFDLLLISQLPF